MKQGVVMSIKKYMLIAFSIKSALLICSIIIVYTMQSAITLDRTNEWLFSPILTPSDYTKNLTDAKKDNQLEELLSLKNERGETPLLYAVDHDDLERVKILLSFNADPNVRDTGLYEGTSANTVLHRAMYHGDSINTIPIMQALLQAGANPRLANDHGSTPLHLAGWITNSIDTQDIGSTTTQIPGRRMSAIIMLTNAGADINTQDAQGKTLLHLLVDKRDTSFIEKLILQFPLTLSRDVKDKNGRTPVEYARFLFEPDPEDLVTSLSIEVPPSAKTVEKKAEPTYDQGVTPLMIAIIKNDKPTLENLISLKETDLQAQAQNGNTALHYAVLSQDPLSFITLLLAKKSNVHSLNKQGNSPLHLLYLIPDAQTRYKAFQLLIQAGSNLSLANSNGDTPLHLAVKNKDKELVQLIVKKLGITAKNSDGATVYDLAQKLEDPDIAKIVAPYFKNI